MNKVVPLATICNYIRGITFKPEDKVEIGTVDSAICMRTKNIQKILDESDLIAIPKKHVKRKEQFLKTGDILISSANSWDLVGKCVKVPKLKYEATAGGFISILRPDSSQVDSNYLYYWLSSNSVQLKVRYCARQTTNIANLDANQFLDLKIPLPPLPEQKRIAAILDKADAVRRKRQETIRLLDEFLRSVFLEMFGDPVRNEKGFKLEKLDNVSNSRLGKMRDEKQISGNYLKPYLGNSNVKWFSFDLDNLLEMDFNAEEQEKYSLKQGDLLVCEGGEIGRCAIWKNNLTDCYFQKALHRVRVDTQIILAEYLQYVLWFYSQANGFKDVSSRSTITHLTSEKLKTLLIPLPHISLQNIFAQIIEKTERQRKLLEKSLDEMENGFDSLMQKAFWGEL